MNKILSGVTGLALFSAVSAANAAVVTVDFSAGAVDAVTYKNDTISVSASPAGSSVSFTTAGVNVPIVVPDVVLQNLVWTSGAIPSKGGNFDIDITRSISATLNAASLSDTISQDSNLHIVGKPSGKGVAGPNTLSTYAADSEIEFDFTGYKLTIDPEGQTFTQFAGAGAHSFALKANFTLTPVPEASTMVAGAGALGLLLLGAGVHSKRSVQRIG